MSKHFLKSNILENVRQDIEDDLANFQSLQLPNFEEIQGFDPLDDIYKLKPKNIQVANSLPPVGHQVIYIFELNSVFENERAIECFVNELQKVKIDEAKSYSQITTVKKGKCSELTPNKNGITLYVGTSQNFASRLKTHVGYGSKGTATILLRKWPGIISGNLKIKAGYYDFGRNISPDLLKRIEFYLSEQIKPIIGHNRRA